MDFEGSYKALLSHKYFNLHIFDNETAVLLNCFEICTEMHFVYLFFLNHFFLYFFCLIFEEKYFSGYVLLTDQILLSGDIGKHVYCNCLFGRF